MIIQKCFTHYSYLFFKELSDAYDVKHILTDSAHATKVYRDHPYAQDEIRNMDITLLRFPKFFRMLKVATLSDYDILCITDIDDIWETIRFLPCLIIAKIRKKKILYEFDYWESSADYSIPWNRKLRRSLINFLRKPILKHTDMFLPYGKFPKQFLLRQHVSASRIIPIAGVASSMPEESGEASIRDLHDIPDEDLILLYFGRIVPRKGLDILIRTFLDQGLATSCTLLIAGGGRGAFVDKCQKLAGGHAKIRFIGHVPAWIRYQYLHESDIFILPCYPLYNAVEPWGFTVNEAMQAGTAVVVSDNAGVTDVIEHGYNALIVSGVQLESDLGLQLKKLTSDPILREKIAQNGHTTFKEKLQVSNKTNGYREAIKSLLA